MWRVVEHGRARWWLADMFRLSAPNEEGDEESEDSESEDEEADDDSG